MATSVYQDLHTAEDAARIAYSDQKKQNPAAAGAFTQDTVAALKTELMALKQNALAQVETDLARAQDQTANLKLYQRRTADTDDLATQIERNNQVVQGQLADDKAFTKRQFEINEWYNYKKQSTAYLLMNLAITMGVLLIVTVAWKMGVVPPGGFNWMAGSIVVYGVISTGWRMYSMAPPGQDAILWHRRRFGPSTIDPVKSKCDPITGELIPVKIEINPCVSEAAQKLAHLAEVTEKDLESYLAGTTTPSAICSSAKAEPFVSTSV